MRYYLLASAALFGLSVGAAQAATVDTAGVGDFGPAGPSTDFSSVVNAPQTSPDPGKVNVRIGGWMMTAMGVAGSTLNHGSTDASVNALVPGTKNSKQDPYGFSSFIYLYFGADGRTQNNIIYGAEAEVRENNQEGVGTLTPGSTTVSLGGETVGSSATNSTNTLMYIRRAYTYIGADQFGLVKFGSNGGPEEMFEGCTTGICYSRGGGWDADTGNFVDSNAKVTWVFADNGTVYTTFRLTYISPTFLGGGAPARFNMNAGTNGPIMANGFNVAASFAPSSADTNDAENVDSSVGLGANQSASVQLSDAARARNIFEALIKWSGAVGPAGLYATAGYTGSNTVRYVGTPSATVANNYYGLSMVDLSGTASFAGITVFGHMTTGKFNGPDTTEPKTPHSKNGMAWIEGASYAIGPWMVGAYYYTFESTGSNSTALTVGPREERGIDIGAKYTLEPGVFFATDEIYGTRHERGVNFEDTSPGALGSLGNNTRALAGDLSFNVMW
jgi:hypothetical protein